MVKRLLGIVYKRKIQARYKNRVKGIATVKFVEGKKMLPQKKEWWTLATWARSTKTFVSKGLYKLKWQTEGEILVAFQDE
jgi:hypothetical protein